MKFIFQIQKGSSYKTSLSSICYAMMYLDLTATKLHQFRKQNPAKWRAHDIIIISDASCYIVYSLTIFMNNLFQRAYNSIFTQNYFHVNEQHNLHP